MVRRKLREKSSKQKAPVKVSQPLAVKMTNLSRGQRKRLQTKTRIMVKNNPAIVTSIKNERIKKHLKAFVEDDSSEDNEHLEKEKNMTKKSKGAPKSQKKKNEVLFVEMQRFQNVMLNETVREDPYAAVRQYLQNKSKSKME